MDVDDVAQDLVHYLRRTEACEVATLETLPRRLRHAAQDGLDVDQVLASPAAALAAGNDYLEWRELSAGRSGYNNSVKLLNALCRMSSWTGVAWRQRRATDPAPRALESYELEKCRQAASEMPFLARARALALLTFAVGTGLRRGEIHAVRYADLDFHAPRLDVRSPSKHGRRRRVPILVDDVVDGNGWTRTWWEARPHTDDAVWTSLEDPHGQLCSSRVYTVLHELGVRAGVPLSLQYTRHTFARRARLAGVQLDDLQYLMGHAKVESTRYYARRSADEIAAATAGVHVAGLGLGHPVSQSYGVTA